MKPRIPRVSAAKKLSRGKESDAVNAPGNLQSSWALHVGPTTDSAPAPTDRSRVVQGRGQAPLAGSEHGILGLKDTKGIPDGVHIGRVDADLQGVVPVLDLECETLQQVTENDDLGSGELLHGLPSSLGVLGTTPGTRPVSHDCQVPPVPGTWGTVQ